MITKQVLLAEMTWEEIREAGQAGAIVILPVGATEQHGPHLAIKTDTALVFEIAVRAATLASQKTPVVVAPALPYGYSGYHAGFPGSPSIAQQTYIHVIEELGQSLLGTDFKRLLILNGHGGNTAALAVAAEDLYHRTHAAIAVANYWTLAAQEIGSIRASAPGGICHACELETSCMLALDRSAVRPEKIAKAIPKWDGEKVLCDLVAKSELCPAFRAAEVSSSGVMGDPTLASAEKGQKFLNAIVERVTNLIIDLARWDVKQVRS